MAPDTNPFPAPPTRTPMKRVSRWGDWTFLALVIAATVTVVGVLVTLVVVLVYGSRLTIQSLGFSFLYITTWNPNNNIYGIVPFLYGTLITSALALLLAVPLGLGASIFLTQHAPAWLRRPVGQLIELLAAIPSVVYGFWGLIYLVPVERNLTEPFLKTWLGWTGLFGGTPFGIDYLTAGLVLSIMAVPTITALSRDAIAAVPLAQKEAAISLGATNWEVTRRAVLPYARSGIVGGIVLGLGRALGETMAVLLTIGNTYKIGTSLFASGETIAGGIATNFFEATGPADVSALLEAGLVLLLIALAINLGARAILRRFQSGTAAEAE
jgi:phosphate transport system permease protein